MLDVGYYGIFYIATTHTPFVLEKNQAKKTRAPSWFNREILHSEVKPSYEGDLTRPQTRPRVSIPIKVAEVSGIPRLFPGKSLDFCENITVFHLAKLCGEMEFQM